MDVITFPKNEWNDIKSRFDNGKFVYTIRVSDECGKFKIGDILKTEWSQKIKVISVKKITDGIDELKKEYEFFSELTKEMVQELSLYNEMDIVVLEVI